MKIFAIGAAIIFGLMLVFVICFFFYTLFDSSMWNCTKTVNTNTTWINHSDNTKRIQVSPTCIRYERD